MIEITGWILLSIIGITLWENGVKKIIEGKKWTY